MRQLTDEEFKAASDYANKVSKNDTYREYLRVAYCAALQSTTPEDTVKKMAQALQEAKDTIEWMHDLMDWSESPKAKYGKDGYNAFVSDKFNTPMNGISACEAALDEYNKTKQP